MPLYILWLWMSLLGGGKPMADPVRTSPPALPAGYTTLDTTGVPRMRLPFGNAQIIKYAFPETWEHNPKTGRVEPEDGHPAGMDSVLRGLAKPYNRLYQTDCPIIAKIKPDSGLIDPFLMQRDYYKVDLHIGPVGYFVYDSTVVVLFKDAGAYQPLIGEENVAVLQYIYLVTYRNGQLADQVLAYFEDIGLYEKNARYFYLNKKGQLYLREFYFGELEHGATGVAQFQIGADGMFNRVGR